MSPAALTSINQISLGSRLDLAQISIKSRSTFDQTSIKFHLSLSIPPTYSPKSILFIYSHIQFCLSQISFYLSIYRKCPTKSRLLSLLGNPTTKSRAYGSNLFWYMGRLVMLQWRELAPKRMLIKKLWPISGSQLRMDPSCKYNIPKQLQKHGIC